VDLEQIITLDVIFKFAVGELTSSQIVQSERKQSIN